MTFHLFTYVASVFSEEGNEKTGGGRIGPLTYCMTSPKIVTYPTDLSVLSTPGRVTAAGLPQQYSQLAPHINMLFIATCHCFTKEELYTLHTLK